MSTPKHIKFKIRRASTDNQGHYTQASVRAIGGDLLEEDSDFQKYCIDVIAHALTHTGGNTAIENLAFTYTFPFKLA